MGKSSGFNAVAGDGGEVFFTTGVNSECSGQLFVRLGGSRTLEVSRPLEAGKAVGGCVGKGVVGEVPCEGAETRAPAVFQGANESGSKVFFTTASPLDPDGNDLYMARIECSGGGEGCEVSKREVGSLVQVSAGSEAADVQGVVTVSSDGSQVYFVARGVLDTSANSEGQAAVKGADNLYVYNSVSGAAPSFIGDLCSGPELSGETEDVDCPSDLLPESNEQGNDTGLWVSVSHQVQTNSCEAGSVSCEPGRFLVFSAYARLTRDDTDNAKDVYRYDADTGVLTRVSVGEDGYEANGNGSACVGSACDATIGANEEQALVYRQNDLDSRAVSEDGSRIVFTSGDALSEDASNGLANAYEWQSAQDGNGGSVSLISTGSGSEPVEDVVISRSGRDVFFVTSQGLVPQDTDGQSDVYDARLGGGFPPVSLEPRQCEGEACQGPLTNPAPLLVPGSVSQAPGGNVPAPVSKPTVKKAKPKRKTKSKKPKSKKKSKSRKGKASRSPGGR